MLLRIDFNFKETTTAHCSVPMLKRQSDEASPSHRWCNAELANPTNSPSACIRPFILVLLLPHPYSTSGETKNMVSAEKSELTNCVFNVCKKLMDHYNQVGLNLSSLRVQCASICLGSKTRLDGTQEHLYRQSVLCVVCHWVPCGGWCPVSRGVCCVLQAYLSFALSKMYYAYDTAGRGTGRGAAVDEVQHRSIGATQHISTTA